MKKSSKFNLTSIRVHLHCLVLLSLLLSAFSIVPKTTQAAADISFVSFNRLAATGDDPPGMTGAFTDFDIFRYNIGFPIQINAPAIGESGRVAFVGRDAALPVDSVFNSGIFTADGVNITDFGIVRNDRTNITAANLSRNSTQIFTAADRADNAPGNVGNFVSFSEPGISGAGVAFRGRDSIFRSGIFVRLGGILGLTSVAQFGDSVPGFDDTFNSVSSPNISGNIVAFEGNFPAGVADKRGIFFGTAVRFSLLPITPTRLTIAVTGDDPPGSVGPLVDFGGGVDNVTNLRSTVVFRGQDADFNDGIFMGGFQLRAQVRNLQTVVSEGDALPGLDGSFTGSQGLDLNETKLVFRAFSTAFDEGIFAADLETGSIVKIAKKFEEAPGSVGQFAVFESSAVSDSMVAFTARDAGGNQGLYVSIDDRLTKIADTFDTLNRKRIAAITFGAQGLDGTSLAFGVTFADGSQAVYRADLTLNN
jgi:hypothetical protein